MNGFINLLKPPGMSSGNAVAQIKRLTGEKVGHAGTLDPEASGILPIMVGRATRLLNYFSEKEKTYIAEISFQGATDTQDAQGEIIENGRGKPSEEAFKSVIQRFIGEIDQCPPAYSALKRGGTPLYKLARQGIEVKTEARKTSVHAIDLLDETEVGYLICVKCGGGTYIRTLCHDIGQALGCPAHMRFLLRTQVGVFCAEHAVTLEELEQGKADGRLEEMLLPMDAPLAHLPRIDVPERLYKQAANGVSLPISAFGIQQSDSPHRVYIRDQLLGIVKPENDMFKFAVIVRSYNEI